MWRAFLGPSMREQTLMCFCFIPPCLRCNLVTSKSTSATSQSLPRIQHVWYFTVFCLFLICVVLLPPGPIWHHWKAHTVWPGAGREVCEICEGEDRDWAKLCQTTEVGLFLFFFSPPLFFTLLLPNCHKELCTSVLLKAACSICVLLCLHGCLLKGCLWNACWSYDHCGTESNLCVKH